MSARAGRRTFVKRTTTQRPSRTRVIRPVVAVQTRAKKPSLKKQAEVRSKEAVAERKKTQPPVVILQTTARRTPTKTVGGRGVVGEVRRTQQIAQAKRAEAERKKKVAQSRRALEARRRAEEKAAEARRKAEEAKREAEQKRLEASQEVTVRKAAEKGKLARAQAIADRKAKEAEAKAMQAEKRAQEKRDLERRIAQSEIAGVPISDIQQRITTIQGLADQPPPPRPVQQQAPPPVDFDSATFIEQARALPFGGFGSAEARDRALEEARERARQKFPDAVARATSGEGAVSSALIGPREPVTETVEIGGPSFIGGVAPAEPTERFDRRELPSQAPRQEFISPTGAVTLQPTTKEQRREQVLTQRGGAPQQVSLGSLAIQRQQEGQILGRGEQISRAGAPIEGVERDVALRTRQEQDVFRVLNVAQADRFRAISGARSGIEALQIAEQTARPEVFTTFGRGVGVTGFAFEDPLGRVTGTVGPTPTAGFETFGLERESTRGILQTPEGREVARQRLAELPPFTVTEGLGFQPPPTRPTGELVVRTDRPLGEAPRTVAPRPTFRPKEGLISVRRADGSVIEVTPETAERLGRRGQLSPISTQQTVQRVGGGPIPPTPTPPTSPPVLDVLPSPTVFPVGSIANIAPQADPQKIRSSSQRVEVDPLTGVKSTITEVTQNGQFVGRVVERSSPTEFQGQLPPAFASSIGTGEESFAPKAGEPQGIERIGLGFTRSLENELAGLQNIGATLTGGQIPTREFQSVPSEQLFSGVIGGGIAEVTGERGAFVRQTVKGGQRAVRQAQQDPFLTIGDVGAQALLFLPVGAAKAVGTGARVVSRVLPKTSKIRGAPRAPTPQPLAEVATITPPPAKIPTTPSRAVTLGFTADVPERIAPRVTTIGTPLTVTQRVTPVTGRAGVPTVEELTRVGARIGEPRAIQARRFGLEQVRERKVVPAGRGESPIIGLSKQADDLQIATDPFGDIGRTTRRQPRGRFETQEQRLGIAETTPPRGEFQPFGQIGARAQRGRAGILSGVDVESRIGQRVTQTGTRVQDIFSPTTGRRTGTRQRTQRTRPTSEEPRTGATTTGRGGTVLELIPPPVRSTGRGVSRATDDLARITEDVFTPPTRPSRFAGGGRGTLPKTPRRGIAPQGGLLPLAGIAGAGTVTTGLVTQQPDTRLGETDVFARITSIAQRERVRPRTRQRQAVRQSFRFAEPEVRTPRQATVFDQPFRQRQQQVQDFPPFRPQRGRGGPAGFAFFGEGDEDAGRGRRQRRFFRVFDVARTPFGRTERGLGVQVQSDVPIFEVSDVRGRAPPVNITERFFEGDQTARTGRRLRRGDNPTFDNNFEDFFS